MYDQRDRLLGAMFVIQLVGALVLGLVVVNAIGDGDVGGQVVIADGAGSTSAGVVGGGDVDDGTASGTTGTSGSSTDGTSGSSGATTGSGTTTTTTRSGGTTSSGGGSGTTTSAAGGTSGDDAGDGGAAGDQGGAAPAGDGGGGAPASEPAAQPAEGGGDQPAASSRPEGENRTGITDDEILVGVLVTQSGAINFKSSAQATKAYFDALNEAGGINGRQVRAIIRDDGLDENRGAQAVEEMINAGVFAFVAFNAPLSEQTVLGTIEKNGIPLIGAFAIPPSPIGYLFSAPYETYGRVGGAALGSEDVETPALIFISNQNADTDRIIEESYRLGLESVGKSLDPANVFPVDVTKTSFDDVVTDMRFNGVDGIATILDATGMVRLQQSLNRAAYNPVHVSSPFGGDPSVIDNPNVGSSFNGTIVLSDVHFLGSGQPEMDRYESEVSRRFGGEAELNWAGQHGWLGAKMFSDVMTSLGGDPTREALLEGMNSLREFQTGMTFPLTITEDIETHSANNGCMKVGVVESGKVVQTQDWTCPARTLQGAGVG